jgi:hypothetical protein
MTGPTADPFVVLSFLNFLFYICRIRWPKGVEPPDCRNPQSMGAIEKAMRNSKNRTKPFIFELVLGMMFDSRAEAYQFFNLHSWEVGFGIRFGTSSRNRVNKYRTMQEIVYEKEVCSYLLSSHSINAKAVIWTTILVTVSLLYAGI